MRFSEVEISELTKAWLAISLAFAIVWRDLSGLGISFAMVYMIAALTVGIAFLLHELAHKYVAQRYGCWAEFRSYTIGLLLAVLMSFVGFIFAAPGAVVISGLVTPEENGKIAMAGPIMNIVLAGLFYVLMLVLTPVLSGNSPGQLSMVMGIFFQVGYSINAWLAFFNLIPFGPLDGVKVMRWSRNIWLGLIIMAGLMTFVGF